MAGKTKAELQAEVLLLDPSANVEGLTNAELTALLDGLQQTETETEKQYYIAPGRAVRCKKGILASGEVIKPEYVANGTTDIEALIANGAVVES